MFTKHGKSQGLFKKFSFFFRKHFWSCKEFKQRSWIVELRQSHQKSEFIVRLLQEIFSWEKKRASDERKSFQKIKSFYWEIKKRKSYSKGKKKKILFSKASKQSFKKFIVRSSLRKRLSILKEKYNTSLWTKRKTFNAKSPKYLRAMPFIRSRWHFPDEIFFTPRLRSTREKLFFYWKKSFSRKPISFFKKKKFFMFRSNQTIKKPTRKTFFSSPSEVWPRDKQKNFIFFFMKKIKKNFSRKHPTFSKKSNSTKGKTAFSPEEISFEIDFNSWTRNKSYKDNYPIRRSFFSFLNLFKNKKTMDDQRVHWGTFKKILRLNPTMANPSKKIFFEFFRSKLWQNSKFNFFSLAKFYQLRSFEPRLGYKIKECRIVDVENGVELTYMILTRNWKNVSYAQFYEEFFFILRPSIRLSTITVGHKTSRRIITKPHFKASILEKDKVIFSMLFNEINKNEKYNFLRRNTVRKPNKKKKKLLKPFRRKSERLVEPFHRRLGAQLHQMLILGGTLRRELDLYDQEISRHKVPFEKHFRWVS
jgi:hypothetical protein